MQRFSTKAIRLLQQLNRQARRFSSAGLAALLFLSACSAPKPDQNALLDSLSARFDSSFVPVHSVDPAAPGATTETTPTLAEIEAGRLSRLQILTRLETIGADTLSAPEQQKYFALLDQLAPQVELDRFSMEGIDAPGPYLLTDRHGAYLTLIQALTTQPIADRAAADVWLAGLSDAANAIDMETQRFLVETATDVIPPRVIIDRAINDLSRQLDPNREPLVLQHFRTEISGLSQIPDFESARLSDEARTIYASEVAPELAKLRETFVDLRERAPTDVGLWAQPDGERRYTALFSFFTTPGLPPDEIADLAATEMEDARLEAEVLLHELDETDVGTVGERLAALAIAPESPPDEAPDADVTPLDTTAAIGARLTQRFDWARNNLAQMISTGSIRPLVIQPRPLAAHEPRWPVRHVPQSDQTASDALLFDAGAFANWPDWSLPVLAYTEALPGRHLITSQRTLGHPTRSSGGLSAGWAFYAAGLASELGGYDDRIEDRLGYLQFAILQAGLAAADIGIHRGHWSQDEAVGFLEDSTGLPSPILASFVDEIIRRPGQAASAFAGKEAIWNFRDRADHRLGPRFDLRQFHDRILAGGPRPIASAERDIERWISELEAPPPAN